MIDSKNESHEQSLSFAVQNLVLLFFTFLHLDHTYILTVDSSNVSRWPNNAYC